jgi:hypothetical protein
MFLSNEWITWVWDTFSMAIVAFPSVIGLILKVIAIYNPNVKSNEVTELIEKYWPKG